MPRRGDPPFDPFALPPGFPTPYEYLPDPEPTWEDTASSIAGLLGLLAGGGLGLAALTATIAYFQQL